jgi:hypothetical protein
MIQRGLRLRDLGLMHDVVKIKFVLEFITPLTRFIYHAS